MTQTKTPRRQLETGTDGEVVASATNLVLDPNINEFVITGSIPIETISITGWKSKPIRLCFDSDIRIVHLANGGDPGDFSLNGSDDAIASDGGNLVISKNGADLWEEDSRK